MDQRKRKEEFYKKIDKMIKGKGKRPRKNSNNINANSVVSKIFFNRQNTNFVF